MGTTRKGRNKIIRLAQKKPDKTINIMIKLIVLWFLIIIIGMFCSNREMYAQGTHLDSSFATEELNLQVYSPKRKENKKLIDNLDKREVLISFHEGFSDSVLVYVNDSLFMQKPVVSDTLGLGYSVAAVKIDFNCLKKREAQVIIALKEKRKYIAFSLDRKFRMIQVHRISGIWYLAKTNYVPEYQ